MSGNIILKSNIMDRSDTIPSEESWTPYIYFVDKNNKKIGEIGSFQLTTGRTGIRILGAGEYNNNELTNGITFGIEADGTAAIGITYRAAFRQALTSGTTNADAKFFRGDGELTNVLVNKPFEAQYNAFDVTSANNGTSATAWPSLARTLDKNGVAISYVGTTVYSNGDVATSLYAYNYKTDGTSSGNNYINVFMRKDGTKAYGIADQGAFRSAIGLEDSGWVNITLASGFTAYSSSSQLRCRKIGSLVQIQGVVKNTNAIAAGTISTIGTIPAGYRPSYEMKAVCQGSGTSRFLVDIYANGNIMLDRYGTSTSEAIGAGSWINVYIMYLIG